MKRSRKDSRARLLKVPTTVYLEPAQAAALARLHARTRVPQTIYLREAVDMLLAKYTEESRP